MYEAVLFRDHIDCICNIWNGPEELGLSGALGGPGFRWWARHTYIFTDVFFDMPLRVSMCIEQGPSLPL